MDTQRFILFLYAQAGSMHLNEAVELGRLLGKSSASVRGCVSRLTRTGLLIRIASGRNSARYALSPTGKTLARGINAKFRQIHDIVEERDPWDGAWTLVSFDIPESIRDRRDQFRMGLREIGFGQLTSGLWIAARDKSTNVFSLAASLHIQGKVIVTIPRDITYGTSSISSRMHKIWPLAKLNRDYAAMKKRMGKRLDRFKKKINSGRPPDARDVFLELFTVFTEATELISQDPCLPKELLPPRWLGLEVQDLIHEFFHVVHGVEMSDPYAYLINLPEGLHIPLPRQHEEQMS